MILLAPPLVPEHAPNARSLEALRLIGAHQESVVHVEILIISERLRKSYDVWRIETSAPGAPAPSPPVVAISSTRYDGMAHLSPDGRRVAFSSGRSGRGEIWLADPDGSNAVRLTSTGVFATGYPRWSADGRLIVFHSNFEGQPEIYVIPAAGGKP